MKAFGYAESKIDKSRLLDLNEITLEGTSTEIRLIANFLLAMADDMENRPKEFDHRHMQDEITKWDPNWPDFIVAAPEER